MNEYLLTEIAVQHLPKIRWFKNNWMDFVVETNSKGDLTQFSISYHHAEENNLNIEWDGSELFGSREMYEKALHLLKDYGSNVPPEIIDFVKLRLLVFL